jgi:hypothetical protein
MTTLPPGCQPQDCCGDPSAHLPTAGQAPATDRAALRDRIRRAVCDALGVRWAEEPPEADDYGDVADAVLAVLPAPVCICGHPEERHFEDVCQTCGCGDYLEPRDAAEVIARWRQAALKVRDGERAAVLREAADRIDREDLPQDDVDMFDNGARWATKLLRRMADEAQPATDRPTTDVAAAIVAALQKRAEELTTLAEQEMRPSLEERAQQWHEAAELARRTAAGARQNGVQQ